MRHGSYNADYHGEHPGDHQSFHYGRHHASCHDAQQQTTTKGRRRRRRLTLLLSAPPKVAPCCCCCWRRGPDQWVAKDPTMGWPRTRARAGHPSKVLTKSRPKLRLFHKDWFPSQDSVLFTLLNSLDTCQFPSQNSALFTKLGPFTRSRRP